MPAAAANGIQISYTDSGGQGPALVFSHGFLLDHTMFDRQVAALAPQYRVITWDQRARRHPSPGAFTYWDPAAGLLVLLGHLGVERVVLAGMSQGGFLSLRAALTAPDWVRALVLTGSEVGLGTRPPRRGMSRCARPGWSTDPGRCRRWSPRSSWARVGGRLVHQVERAVRAVGAGGSGAADLAVPVPDGQG